MNSRHIVNTVSNYISQASTEDLLEIYSMIYVELREREEVIKTQPESKL